MINHEDIKSVKFRLNAHWDEEESVICEMVVSDELLNAAIDKIEQRLKEIYVPLPVCGGECVREEPWGNCLFDDFWLEAYVTEEDFEPKLKFIFAQEIGTTIEELDGREEHWWECKIHPQFWIEVLSAFNSVFKEK